MYESYNCRYVSTYNSCMFDNMHTEGHIPRHNVSDSIHTAICLIMDIKLSSNKAICIRFYHGVTETLRRSLDCSRVNIDGQNQMHLHHNPPLVSTIYFPVNCCRIMCS